MRDPLLNGEGQTFKQSQLQSSVGALGSSQVVEQTLNSSDDRVQNMHSQFVAALQKLIADAKIGALNGVGAIHEAGHLIVNYSLNCE